MSIPQSQNPLNASKHIDSAVFDSPLLQAAYFIYQTYYKTSGKQRRQPHGVAIDRFSLRGKLIFTARPILLPRECFVPLSQIQGVVSPNL
jgi:hypothetical protein